MGHGKEDRRLKSKSDVHGLPHKRDTNLFDNSGPVKGEEHNTSNNAGNKFFVGKSEFFWIGYDTFKLINNQMDTIKNEFARLSEEIRVSHTPEENERSLSRSRTNKNLDDQ